MKNMFFSQKMMFFMFLILSIFISLSSNSILGIWMGLEMNLISIIPVFYTSKSMKMEKSVMIFFLIQSISSTMFFFSFLGSYLLLEWNFFMYMLMFFSIFLKMGFAPFHLWVPTVMEGLTWMGCFIFTTLQKIIPFMLMFFIIPQKIIISLCLMNSLLASVGGINQFSIRKIMSFSSINHLSLMMISIFLSKKLFKIYFLIYFLSIFSLFLFFEKMKMNFLFESFFLKKVDMFINLNMMFFMLSISGVPPFLGFYPKMYVIFKMIEINFFLSGFFILFFNVVATFFYLRTSLSSMLMNLNNSKMFLKKINNLKELMFFVVLFPFISFFF